MIETEHKHAWKCLNTGNVVSTKLVCDCNTITDIQNLVTNAEKTSYDKGVKDTYYRCINNGWLRDNARTIVLKTFKLREERESLSLL